MEFHPNCRAREVTLAKNAMKFSGVLSNLLSSAAIALYYNFILAGIDQSSTVLSQPGPKANMGAGGVGLAGGTAAMMGWGGAVIAGISPCWSSPVSPAWRLFPV